MYREHVDASSQNEKVFYSADLQKVIMLPRMDTFKSVLFTKRIIVFNESFVPLGKIKNALTPLAVLWHEGIAGRKKEDIVSTFNAFFKHNRDVKHIVLWLDNCSAQNKNLTLFTFFVQTVNSEEIALETLEIFYFEPGHTFMSADSFHHQMELSMKKKGKAYDFNDFKAAVSDSNLKVQVKEMYPSDFVEWKDLSSIYKIRKVKPRAYLNAMVQVNANRGSRVLHYRNDFDSAFMKLDFLNTKAMNLPFVLPASRIVGRGIPQEKKDDILSKLCPPMPHNRRLFWEHLIVDNVLDLIDNIEDGN